MTKFIYKGFLTPTNLRSDNVTRKNAIPELDVYEPVIVKQEIKIQPQEEYERELATIRLLFGEEEVKERELERQKELARESGQPSEEDEIIDLKRYLEHENYFTLLRYYQGPTMAEQMPISVHETLDWMLLTENLEDFYWVYAPSYYKELMYRDDEELEWKPKQIQIFGNNLNCILLIYMMH